MKFRAQVLLMTMAAALTYGQTARAVLTGVVTDQTGAALADTTVTALHVDSGFTATGNTSDTGNYSISQLLVGRYEITVERAGFKTFHRDGLTLSAAQSLRLDVIMEVGTATESVTVTAESSLLKTESGTLVHNITPAQIQALPLLPVSGFIRDPFAMVQTLPGVVYTVPAPGSLAGPTMRVNGLSGTTTNQYRLDGEVLGNIAAAGITTRTQPSPDAIEEVAVQTSNFNAEFGSVSGALFNITLKSGTNQFHGTVYDYTVNEVLNANDPTVGAKNRVRRHDYGFNVGGPIKIPHLYNGTNKTFFFANWEQYRDVQQQLTGFTVPTVPTQAYRDGNYGGLFAASGNVNLRMAAVTGGAAAHDYLDPLGVAARLGTVYDPRSTRQVTCNTTVSIDCGTNGTLINVRTAFPGNVVPTTLFDPIALAIQSKYIPLPLGPGADSGSLINNYYKPFKTWRITRTPALKFDHNLSTKGRVSFTYTENNTHSPVQALGGLAEGFDSVISTNRGTYESSPTYRANFDYTLRPTINLHLGAGWSEFNFADNALITDYNPLADIGLKGATLNRNFPRIGANFTSTPAVGGMNAMGPSPQGASPEKRPSGTASVTWVKSNHTFKFGGDFRQDMLTTRTFTNTAGNLVFSGNGATWQSSLLGISGFTGNTNLGFGYANFLMGSVRSMTLGTPVGYRRHKQQWGTYAQDTWRARRNLTIDIGLRWDYGTYTREDYGRVANLSLTEPNASAGGHAGALIYEATCKCNFAKNYPLGIGPRVGLSYTLNNKTVIRGGVGLTYGSTGTVAGTAQNNAVTQDVQDGEESFKLRDGYPANLQPQWPVYSASLGHANGAVIGTLANLVDPNAGRPERVFQWNLSLQREISRNLVVEASYAANRAVWLAAGGFQDFNAISPAQLSRLGFTIGNLADATMLNQRFDLLNATQRSTLAQRGVNVPYGSFPTVGTSAQTVLQSIKPYPQYSNAISPTAPLGRSWYDSLQLTVTKRYSNGLQVNANYTWSKNLQQLSAFDVFNRANGKDVANGANFNPPQLLRISFLYELQRPSQDIPVLGSRWARQAIGGWGISASLFYQTGTYLGRPLSGAANPISRWLGRGPGGANLKQNADGSYMSPWSVDWVDNSGTRRTDPLNINCHCFDPEKTLVLNPNAWDVVPDGQWAAQTQILPDFRRARTPNEAANVARTFRFGHENRYSLQVRVEFQNIFNRYFLPVPQIAGLNFTNPTITQTGGRYTSGFGTFGNLRAANALGVPRAGQFIARFSF